MIPVAVSLDTDFEFNAENLELYFPPTSSSYSGDISNGKNSTCVEAVDVPKLTRWSCTSCDHYAYRAPERNRLKQHSDFGLDTRGTLCQ